MGCKAQSRPPPVALRGCAVAATPLSCLWSAPLWPAVLVSPRPVAWSRASGGNLCAASVGQTWPSLTVEPVGPSTVDVVLQADTSVPRLSCAEHAPRPLGGGSGDPGPARHRPRSPRRVLCSQKPVGPQLQSKRSERVTARGIRRGARSPGHLHPSRAHEAGTRRGSGEEDGSRRERDIPKSAIQFCRLWGPEINGTKWHPKGRWPRRAT